jgi:hypothetical protein
VIAWRDGFPAKADPEQVAKELRELYEENGSLHPEEIVEYARPKGTALHDCFEWNDKKAAMEYRLREARVILRAVLEDGKPIFVHVLTKDPAPRTTGDYVVLVEALASPEMREQILARALREAELWARRYEELTELSAIIGAVRTTREALAPAGA